MKLSVSAWSIQKSLFEKKVTVIEFIDLCDKNAVDAVELLDCFWEDEEHIRKVKKHLQKIKMPVSAYSISNDFVQDEEKRKTEIEKVKTGIYNAVFLDTKILRIFSGNKKENISFEYAKAWIIESLKECAKYAEKMGVTMVLENHGLFAGKSSQVREIIDSVNSSALRANTDTGNFLLVGEDPVDAVENLKDYIAFVHFKDFAKVSGEGHYAALDGTQYSGTVIGKGEVNMKKVVEVLKASGYEGYLSIEFEGDGDPVEGTLESINYSRSIIC